MGESIMKTLLRRFFILAVILLAAGGIYTYSANAAEYTDWSAWSTTKPAVYDQLETRQVPKTYHMRSYLTQDATTYARCWRSFHIAAGDYSKYNARTSYGEFTHTVDLTAAQFSSCSSHAEGSYYSGSTAGAGYNKGKGTAYAFKGLLYFVNSIDYETQYRYRNIVVTPTDPVTPAPSNPGTTTPSNPGTTTPDNGNGTKQPANTVQTPEIIRAVSGKKGVSLKWKKVSGASGYYIYRNGKKIATIKGSGKCTYMDKKANKNGKVYKYYIRVYKKSGSKKIAGVKGKEVIVICLRQKLSPKIPKKSSDSITVRWTPNKKGYGYEIWYGTDKNFNGCKKIIVKGGKKSSRKITGLRPDTIYYIRIRIIYIYHGEYYYSTFSGTKKGKTSAPVYTYKGIVTNAEDGQPLKNCKLIFRRGKNCRSGKAYKRCYSNSRGCYEVRLKKGYYTIEVCKKNYITIYIIIYVDIDSGGYESNPVSISKPLSAGKVRFVLTWGANPTDLDSHLTGASGSGSRYHVYFAQKTGYYKGKLSADLDVDDTTSYGPETITLDLKKHKKGTYHYYVHDYTNRSLSSSRALAKSGARVTVYKGSKVIATYRVPNKPGTLWHVFSIKNGKLVKKNKMRYMQETTAVK